MVCVYIHLTNSVESLTADGSSFSQNIFLILCKPQDLLTFSQQPVTYPYTDPHLSNLAFQQDL